MVTLPPKQPNPTPALRPHCGAGLFVRLKGDVIGSFACNRIALRGLLCKGRCSTDSDSPSESSALKGLFVRKGRYGAGARQVSLRKWYGAGVVNGLHLFAWVDGMAGQNFLRFADGVK